MTTEGPIDRASGRCVHIRIYASKYLCMHALACKHTHTHTHTVKHVHKCMNAHAFCARAYTHVCECTQA